MSEELTNYLKDLDIKVAYLHSEIKTLERLQIIHDLRIGKYDVVVGINLLREGIDIPEVSLIAILDADKEGFLRSTRSLIQTIGRCARNANGHVIMYADKMTDSMKEAIEETKRRRSIHIYFIFSLIFVRYCFIPSASFVLIISSKFFSSRRIFSTCEGVRGLKRIS